jgi:hypothetical protein
VACIQQSSIVAVCSLVSKPEDDFSGLVMISICQNHSATVFLSFPGNGCVGLINRVSTWALAPLPGGNFFFAISIGISLDAMLFVFRLFRNEI